MSANTLFQITNPSDTTPSAAAGRSFNVRVVRVGDRYGLDDCLVHGERSQPKFYDAENRFHTEPMIEFYDATYAGDENFGPRGQFVSRYYADTLLNDWMTGEPTPDGEGLDLQGDVDAWKVDGICMGQVRRWIRAELGEVAPDDPSAGTPREDRDQAPEKMKPAPRKLCSLANCAKVFKGRGKHRGAFTCRDCGRAFCLHHIGNIEPTRTFGTCAKCSLKKSVRI